MGEANDFFNHVSTVYEQSKNDEEVRAIIANFPSTISANNCEKATFKYYKSSNKLNKAKALQRKLVANTEGKINYEGYLNDTTDKSLFKQYVGVYNKKKNKVTIYDAQLINMYLQSDEKVSEMQSKLEFRERNEMLIQAFGSVKGKRTIENIKRNHEFKKSVSSTIGYAFEQVDKDALEVKDDVASNPIMEYLPHCFGDALTPQDVFPWSSLITENEMDALINPSAVFVESTLDQVHKWTENNTYPNFICKRLTYLPTEPGERLRMSNFLMYTNYLIILFRQKAKDLKKRDIFPLDTPPMIRANLLNKFTSSVADHKWARNMSMKQRDCLLYHTLVACLKIDDCDLVIADLKEDIKARDLVKYYKMMGCKIMSGKNVEGKTVKDNPRAVLTTPFILPEPPKLRAEKRKRE